MSKINNSNELLDLIRSAASNSKNWKKEGVLGIRIAFGSRINHDAQCIIDDFKSSGSLEPDELLLSQEDKNDARDRFVSTKESVLSKDVPRDVDTFFYKLYNDVASPLFHGFLEEMQMTMRDTLVFRRGTLYESLVVNEEFPPNERLLDKLVEYTKRSSNRDLSGLVPTKNLFPPIGSNENIPPSLTLWKRTKNGKEYFGSKHSEVNTIGSNNKANGTFFQLGNRVIDLTRGVLSDCAVSQQKGMNFTSKIGLIEIDTGAKVTKVKYQINGDENVKDETFVTLNTKLIDIVAKAKKWKGYDKIIEERYFDIKKNGKTFTTYVKDELYHDSLGELISMMKLNEGEILKIYSGVRNKQIELDVNDDISM